MQYKDVRNNMTTDTVNYKSFGSSEFSPECYPDTQAGQDAVDCTYKLYYGGAHKRPDSGLSRTVLDGSGKLYACVPEGSRYLLNCIFYCALLLRTFWLCTLYFSNRSRPHSCEV